MFRCFPWEGELETNEGEVELETNEGRVAIVYPVAGSNGSRFQRLRARIDRKLAGTDWGDAE